jgi:hypothetical protein
MHHALTTMIKLRPSAAIVGVLGALYLAVFLLPVWYLEAAMPEGSKNAVVELQWSGITIDGKIHAYDSNTRALQQEVRVTLALFALSLLGLLGYVAVDYRGGSRVLRFSGMGTAAALVAVGLIYFSLNHPKAFAKTFVGDCDEFEGGASPCKNVQGKRTLHEFGQSLTLTWGFSRGMQIAIAVCVLLVGVVGYEVFYGR